jgi:hypothetical protein
VLVLFPSLPFITGSMLYPMTDPRLHFTHPQRLIHLRIHDLRREKSSRESQEKEEKRSGFD